MNRLFRQIIYIALFVGGLSLSPAIAEPTVKSILDTLEKTYAGQGFSANFKQESPIPDLGISESAEGKAYFRKPEKFRWEYTTPEPLNYISDGKTLWIHNTEDNNVWRGNTDTFFGKGNGAGLLTNIKTIREIFTAVFSEKQSEKTWNLLLTPKKGSTLGIIRLQMSISKASSQITRIVTFNSNNEETRIELSNYLLNKPPQEALFTFKIPENATIIPLE